MYVNANFTFPFFLQLSFSGGGPRPAPGALPASRPARRLHTPRGSAVALVSHTDTSGHFRKRTAASLACPDGQRRHCSGTVMKDSEGAVNTSVRATRGGPSDERPPDKGRSPACRTERRVRSFHRAAQTSAQSNPRAARFWGFPLNIPRLRVAATVE